MRNNLTITKYMEPSDFEDDPEFRKKLNNDAHLTVIYGLWIEGAEWDVESQLLIEPTHPLPR